MRVLVVDDEEPLLHLLNNYLNRQGHEVVACSSGRAAVEALVTGPGFDLAVLDHWLPDMDGPELLERVLASSDRIRVLIASGSPMPAHALGSWRVGYIQKPFLPRMLGSAIEELLNRVPAG